MRRPQPGRSYTREFDVGGWDEILPTVQPCRLEGTPWGEATGNDHGLLWCRPWDEVVHRGLSEGATTLDLAVTLEEVPCQFRRSIRLYAADARLDLCYELENLGGHDLPYLWAAHPLIPIEPGMRLELPPGTTARATGAVGERLPVLDTPFRWPLAPSASGLPVDLGSLGVPAEAARAVKIFTERLTEGWVRVIAPGGGEALEFRFDLYTIPCLGLWINDGGWSGLDSGPYRNLGVEPTTSPCDTLAEALERGAAAVPAGGVRSSHWRSSCAPTPDRGEETVHGPSRSLEDARSAGLCVLREAWFGSGRRRGGAPVGDPDATSRSRAEDPRPDPDGLSPGATVPVPDPLHRDPAVAVPRRGAARRPEPRRGSGHPPRDRPRSPRDPTR